MYLLRDRSDDLAAAGIRAFGISRDSPWSHRAWKETLGVDVPLLSDWNGEATRAFDVAFEALGMTDVPMRAAFLIRDGKTMGTDGPFTETKEVVGGFDIIECGSLDEAVEIAAGHPVAQIGSIEVRPASSVGRSEVSTSAGGAPQEA